MLISDFTDLLHLNHAYSCPCTTLSQSLFLLQFELFVLFYPFINLNILSSKIDTQSDSFKYIKGPQSFDTRRFQKTVSASTCLKLVFFATDNIEIERRKSEKENDENA